MLPHRLAFAWAIALAAAPLRAGTITLDMNGFPNAAGGQVTGTGLEKPIPLPKGEPKVDLPNLQGGGTYQVDFFHNSGSGSSDFAFTVDAAGTGVEEVTPGGNGFAQMIKGFKRGDKTLTLLTFPIVFNANGAQTSPYYVSGLIEPYKLAASSGSQKWLAVPGLYQVDNLNNPGGGWEDYRFIIDGKGKIAAAPELPAVPATDTTPALPARPGSEEYIEFRENEVNPRAAIVHFVLTATAPINFIPTHEAFQPAGENNIYELDLIVPIGGGGINVYSFGKNTVGEGTLTGPDGKPAAGATRDNDFIFSPRLRYDLQRQAFYFETTRGPATSVTSEATGTFDGTEEKPLTVKATASIKGPYSKAATQPASRPAATAPATGK